MSVGQVYFNPATEMQSSSLYSNFKYRSNYIAKKIIRYKKEFILSFFLVLKSINRNAYALTNNLVADNIKEDLEQANIERDKLLEEEKKKTEAEKAKSGKYLYFIFIYVLFLSLFFFHFIQRKKRKGWKLKKLKMVNNFLSDFDSFL